MFEDVDINKAGEDMNLKIAMDSSAAESDRYKAYNTYVDSITPTQYMPRVLMQAAGHLMA